MDHRGNAQVHTLFVVLSCGFCQKEYHFRNPAHMGACLSIPVFDQFSKHHYYLLHAADHLPVHKKAVEGKGEICQEETDHVLIDILDLSFKVDQVFRIVESPVVAQETVSSLFIVDALLSGSFQETRKIYVCYDLLQRFFKILLKPSCACNQMKAVLLAVGYKTVPHPDFSGCWP